MYSDGLKALVNLRELGENTRGGVREGDRHGGLAREQRYEMVRKV